MLNPFRHRSVLKKGTPARAMIVERGAVARRAPWFNLAMTLHVDVEGRPPYTVEDRWFVKAVETPALSGSIPVKIDPRDPTRVAIDWPAVRREYGEQRDADFEALGRIRGGKPAGG